MISFKEGLINSEIETVSIANFPNQALTVSPMLSSTFTQALQDKFTRQTRLTLVREDGDMNFEGEITGYTTNPVSISGDEYALMNRLTITVRVRFTNTIEPKSNYDKTFSSYADYSVNRSFMEVEGALIDEIVEKLVDDIFNTAVSSW